MPKAQREMYTVLPEMALRPADAYDRLVKGQGRKRRDRRPDGPNAGRDGRALPAGHSRSSCRASASRKRRSRSRTTSSTPASFDRKFPGFETDIHGLRFAARRRRAAVPRRLRDRGGQPDDPARREGADGRHSLPQAAQGRRDRRSRPTRRPRSCSTRSPPRASRSRFATASTGDVSEDASVGAYIGSVDGRPPRGGAQASCARSGGSVSARRSGRSPIRAASADIEVARR